MNQPPLHESLAPETQQLMLQALMRNLPDRIYFKDRDSRILAASESFMARHGRTMGLTDFDLFSREHAANAFRDEQEIIATGQGIENKLERETWEDGRVTWALTTKRPWRNTDGEIIGTFGLSKDVTESMKTQSALEETNKRLIEATRQAGMAEVATGVLHNVGNVLTTMNVTANLLADRVRESKLGSVQRISALLRENAGDLPGFFANDPRAGKLVSFLETLATALEQERRETMEDVTNLLKSLDHVKDVIWMQQSYAAGVGVVEPLLMSEAVEDALKLSNTALLRHGVTVERQLTDVPAARGERHKVLQILVNLISNAKRAMEGKEPAQRKLVLKTENLGDGRVGVRVIDNGVGIPAENLTKIFSHGFTTRKGGHGFGLHSSAIAAKQMRGDLQVTSEGVDKGATFLLVLPVWSETEDLLDSPERPPIPISGLANS